MGNIINDKHDHIFKTKEKARDGFIRILENSNKEIFPLAIDGDWGSGKSYFVKKVVKKIEEDKLNLEVITIDAYKADYYTNPLQHLCEEILTKLTLKDEIKNVACNLFKNAMEITKNMAIPYIEYSLNDLSASKDEELEKLLNNTNKKLLEKIHINLKSVTKDKNIIIFIDELDRCRPSYSLKMLGIIKHLFSDIDNIKVVWIFNKRMIEKQVENIYGVSEDHSKRYLDKFIRFTYHFPINFEDKNCINNNTTSVKYFLDRFESLVSHYKFYDYNNIVQYMIKENELTLRDVEKIINYFIVYKINSNNYITRKNFIHVFFCIYLMINQEEAFRKLINHQEIRVHDLGEMPSWNSDNMSCYDLFIQLLLDSIKLHELNREEKMSNGDYKVLNQLIDIGKELKYFYEP